MSPNALFRLHARPGAAARLVAVMLCLLRMIPPSAAAQEQLAQTLEPGKGVVREIAGEDAHDYVVRLRRGEFLRAVATSRGIDVGVALYGPGGEQLLTVDFLPYAGPEPISYEAAAEGAYKLEVRTEEPETVRGRYELTNEVKASASAADRDRMTAERLLAQAGALQAEAARGSEAGPGEKDGESAAESVKRYRESLAKLLEQYDEALGLWRRLGDKFWEAYTLHEIGGVQLKLIEVQKALGFYHQALLLQREAGDRAGEVATLFDIGNVYALRTSSLAERRKALEFYHQALTLSRAVGDHFGETFALTSIGNVYFELGERQRALEFFNQALLLQRARGDRGGELDSLLHVGNVYFALGEWRKALEAFNLVLPVAKAAGDPNIFVNIGNVYFELGERQKALEFYNEALRLVRAAGNHFAEAVILGNIGAVYSDMEEWEKALDFYTRAAAVSKTIGDRAGMVNMLEAVALVYSSTGRRQEALEAYNLVLQFRREVGDRAGEADVLNNIGAVYDDMSEWQKALEFYHLALPLKRAVGDRAGEARTLVNLMLLWGNLKKPALGLFYGKQAINIYQQLRSNIKGLDKKLQKSYLQTVESNYRQLADGLVRVGRLAEAEQVLAMLKEEEVFEYLRRDDKVARELLTKLSLTPAEREAFERYDALAGRITAVGREYGELQAESLQHPPGQFPKQARLDELESQLADANKVFFAFLDELKVGFGRDDRRVAEVESGTQALLKELAQPRTVVISTIAGEDRLSLIVTTADAQRAHTVELKAADLNRLVAELRAAVRNPRLDPRPAGRRLYDQIFPDALRRDLEGVRADTIVWSLDGTLRYVPVAALWDGRQYLAERYANVVITLASRDKLNQTASDRSKWQALGVGVSKKYGDFEALAAVPEELCSIVRDPQTAPRCASLAAGGRRGVLAGRSLLDEEFTLPAFKSHLGRYAVVHVASHFSLNPGSEADSYLLLGGGRTDDERRLTLASVREGGARFTGVELLTLSACNTAMSGGDKSNGVEIEGFGAVAQKQGAKSVLATLWPVADPSTRDLMASFYLLLETEPQLSKVEALRRAQLALLNGGDSSGAQGGGRRDAFLDETPGDAAGRLFEDDPKRPYAHPYYWAPFILIGNWR